MFKERSRRRVSLSPVETPSSRTATGSWIAIALIFLAPAAFAAADLSLTKTNSVSGSTPLAVPTWTWTWQLTNVGDATMNAGTATTILLDALPNAGISYGTPVDSFNASASGTVNCSINSFFNLICNTPNLATFNPGGRLTVTVVATATASGSYVNPRPGGGCFTEGFSPSDTNFANDQCSDTVVVTTPVADLTVTKTNNVSGQSTAGGSWTWSLAIQNSPGAGAAANFSNGATILTDNLPNTSITYGTVGISTGGGTTGTVNCSLTTANLVCTAAGAVTVPAGGTITVTVPATASTELTHANPRSGGICTVDPGSVVVESSDANNSCSDTVSTRTADIRVTKTNSVAGSTPLNSPSWTWTFQLQNIGTLAKNYSGGMPVLFDGLPNASISYGTPNVSLNGNVSGSITCSIVSFNLDCRTSGAVTFNPGGVATITIVATATATGTYVNPRAGMGCFTDTINGSPSDLNTANDSCSDTVTVTAVQADLTVTKTNNVSGQSSSGGSWNWSLLVANSAGAATAANFPNGATILRDDLPLTSISYGTPAVSTGGGTTGTVNCSIASFNLTCTAAGPVSIPPAGMITVTVPATASAELVHPNPRSGGVCAVDPGLVVNETSDANNSCSDTVTTQTADMVVTKTNSVSGSTPISSPTWTWTLQAQNIGSLPMTYGNGTQVLGDLLPNINISYGSPNASVNGNVVGTPLSCSINSFHLSCTATGNITFNPGGILTVTIAATATAADSYVNPRSASACFVEGSGSPSDVNTTNNTCSDTVIVRPPDLTVTAVNPDAGPSVGGTMVTITGSGFQSGATVTIGGVAATSVTVSNATTIIATTAPRTTSVTSSGLVDVVVTSGSGSATLSNGYRYLPFDPNGDSQITAADLIHLLNFLFGGGPAPVRSGDANGDRSVNILDVFYAMNFVFVGGPPPQNTTL